MRKILLGLLAATSILGSARAVSPADVNPFIGTAGGGNVYPGAVAPFGMVQFSPDTRTHSIGYSYDDKQIEGFSLTHMSGVGCDDFGDVFLTATTGPVATESAGYQSTYRHDHETASPGYYQVLLDTSGVSVELTATERAGIARFSFPADKPGNILVPISHTLTTSTASQIQVVDDHTITGQVTSKSFCGANATYTVYFAMEVDQPFQTFGVWSGGVTSPGTREASQSGEDKPDGAYVTYPAGPAHTVTARIGISYVDAAGARRNLDREVGRKSFDDVRRDTAKKWARSLAAIETEGGTPDERREFATALYHCLLMPNVASDVDGRYTGFDNQIHNVARGKTLYANFSGWDIYRNEVPLLALIEPKRLEDMCESIALMYRQGGWIDRWPQVNTYTNVMVGSPLTSMVATAWNAGLHDFDIKMAYEGMWKDATEPAPPGKPYNGEAGVQYVDQIGYLPSDKVGHAVSQMEEDCYAYAALASVARSLGKTSDADALDARAEKVFNLYDVQSGFMRPKLLDGHWLTPFGNDEFTKDDWGQYTEGTVWQYLWLVPQDVKGLIRHIGGDAAFNAKLDAFFDGKLYTPYNEPDLQAPFLYDYSGAPWKTQDRVRTLLAAYYSTHPDGIPGNDDCGTMSAWYVFAAMGLYPVDPARPAFEVCSPIFSKVTVHVAGPRKGKFTVEAPAASAENRYIQSAAIGGEPLNATWLSRDALLDGTTLKYTLGPAPAEAWGAAAARPPSLTP